MATQIKKINGVERNSNRKLNGLSISEELFCNTLFSDANLLGYWRLEGNSNDSKGSNNGTDTSVSYSYSYGKFGQGASFTSSSSKIDLGTGLNLAGSPFTICGWIKIADYSRYNNFVNKRDATSTTQYGTTLIINTGKLAYYDGATVYQSNSAVPQNTWVHIAFTLSAASNGTLTFYQNGSNDGSINNVSLGSGASNLPVCLGQVYGETNSLNGYMDDVAIFNRALTATEISNLYHSQIKKFMGVSNV